MKTTIAFVLLLAASLAAQTAPTVTAQPNTIFAGGDGKYESAPDTAVLSFFITAQEATSKAAYDHASRSVDHVRQILRSNGIDPKTAEISSFLEPKLFMGTELVSTLIVSIFNRDVS